MTEKTKEKKSFPEMMPEDGGKLSRQEQNWMMMTTLQIPWKDAEAIDKEEDRAFLMNKVKEVQGFIQEQQKMQAEMEQNQQQRQQAELDGASSIITPDQILR